MFPNKPLPNPNLRMFLQRFKVSDTCLQRIHKRWADRSVEVLKKNPYLIYEIDGVGFDTADSLGRSLGLARNHPGRLRAGVIDFIKSRCAMSGHVCLPRGMIIDGVVDALDFPGKAAIEAAINRLHQDHDVVLEDEMVYLRYVHEAEIFIAEKIKSMQRFAPVPVKMTDESDLFPDQVEAVRGILGHAVSILTGPPGSGKTHALKKIIEVCAGQKISLGAPTGKAAKRIMELSGRKATTIHRLLEAQMGEDGFFFGRDGDCPIDAEVVIIDESSMIDQSLMASFLAAVEEGTRLVLVGDTDQLPPVGAGNVLRDLIRSEAVPTYELTTIKRQDPGLIITNCHRIRKGDDVEAPKVELTDPLSVDFVFIECKSEHKTCSEVVRAATELAQKVGCDPLKQCQVLAPFREKTDLSCKSLNRRLQNWFCPVDPNEIRPPRFREGDKVIQTKNDYDLDIINGDIGYIRSVDPPGRGDRSIYVDFESPDRQVVLNYRDNKLQHAFCITVHKSQGSEFDMVVIPIHSCFGGFFVQRNWLYTAVSRAKKLCVLVGERGEVSKIVKRNQQVRRYTRLWRLFS